MRARFEDTGALSAEQAAELGLVGPAARACGLVRDVRYDHPAGWHRLRAGAGGGLAGRRRVRARAGALARDPALRPVSQRAARASPAEGDVRVEPAAPAPDTLAVALVEGWRGEMCHVALTGPAGRFRRYKIVDPSFHNWIGLALAMRGQAVSDFPLCNKSFNLSYCGFDLCRSSTPCDHVRRRHHHPPTAARLRDDGLSEGPAAPAARPAWRSSPGRDREVPGGLRGVRARVPDAGYRAGARRGDRARPGPLPVLRGVRRGLPARRHHADRRPPDGRPRARGPGARRAGQGDGAPCVGPGREAAQAVRPVAAPARR